jgi:hypothetical protein
MFWRNKKFLGIAFTDIEIGQNRAYYPGVSMEKGMRVVFNFGSSKFSHSINQTVNAINEPDCLINNYYNSSLILLD